MIDLRDKDRQAICQIAEAIFAPDTNLLAYGSRVKGKHHSASDLDLAVQFPPPLDENYIQRQVEDFKLALQNSAIPILVQVFVWHQLPKNFQINIAREQQLLLRVR